MLEILEGKVIFFVYASGFIAGTYGVICAGFAGLNTKSLNDSVILGRLNLAATFGETIFSTC